MYVKWFEVLIWNKVFVFMSIDIILLLYRVKVNLEI